MTQAYVPPYAHVVADGAQTIFPYAYTLGTSADIEVYQNGSLTTAYTLTGVGSASGGNIVFFQPPAVGVVVFHRRVTAKTQTTDYLPNDAFTAAGHEAAVDKLTRLVQDLVEELSRRPAFTVELLSTLRNMALPDPVALKLLGYNANADGITTFDSSIVQVTPSAVSGLAYVKTNVTVNASVGQATLTASNAFPAGTEALYAVAYVTTGFGTSNGLSAIALGDPSEGYDFWAASMGITLASVSNVGQHGGGESSIEKRLFNNGARDILLTGLGGTFDATGQIKITTVSASLTPDS